MIDGYSIATAARSWLGTRFHHQGRLKKTQNHKGGVDCLGLLIGVAHELQINATDGSKITAFDRTDYSHYPDTKALYKTLSSIMHSVLPETLAVGDIILLSIDDNPQHLGIVSDWHDRLGIIHAYAPAHAVVEHELDEYWRSKIVAVFRV